MRENKYRGRYLVAAIVFVCGLPVMAVLAAGTIVTRAITLVFAAGKAIARPFGGSGEDR